MFNFFQKNFPIGINVSDYSIEVVQLNHKLHIRAYGRVLLDEGIVKEGIVRNKEKLAEKLKEVLSSTKPIRLYRPKAHLEVVFNVPESKVFLYHLEILGNVQGEALEKKILEEVSNIVPYDVQKLYQDYVAVSQDQKGYEILYAAAPREIVDDYVDVFASLGMEPIVLDIESIALHRALFQFGSFTQHTSSLIIDMGAQSTIASIFDRKGMLRLSFTIPMAGNHFTEAISQKLKISKDAAEHLKQTYGFDAKNPKHNVFSILRSASQKIIEELSGIIEYYEKKYNQHIEKIVFVGGSALLPKIEEYFSLKLQRKLVDPLMKIQLKGKAPKILYATVLGLALRGLDKKKEGINLLKMSFKESQHRFPKFTLVASLFLLFIVVFLAAAGIISKEKPLSTPPLLPEEHEPSTITQQKIIITDTPTGWLNVREGPGMNFDIIGRVYPGEQYPLLEEQGDWYKIKVDQVTESWVTSEYTEKQ